jgi:hypothetical protein
MPTSSKGTLGQLTIRMCVQDNASQSEPFDEEEASQVEKPKPKKRSVDTEINPPSMKLARMVH